MSTGTTSTSPARRPIGLSFHAGTSSWRAGRLVLCVWLIAGGMLVLHPAATASVEESTETFEAVERIVLDLQAVGGVSVSVHDADEVVVEQRAPKSILGPDVDLSIVGSELHISSAPCSELLTRLVDDCTVSFTLTVPASTEIVGSLVHGDVNLNGLADGANLQAGYGNLNASDISGELDLATGHGSIEIARVEGAVTVTTGHGDMTFEGIAGPVDANTGNGRIRVDNASDDVAVATGHGDMDVTGVLGDTVSLTSGHGDVAFVPGSAPGSVEIRTGHGDVTVTLPPDSPPYSVSVEDSEDAVVSIATDPTSSHQISVTTGHGTIDIRYAAS